MAAKHSGGGTFRLPQLGTPPHAPRHAKPPHEARHRDTSDRPRRRDTAPERYRGQRRETDRYPVRGVQLTAEEYRRLAAGKTVRGVSLAEPLEPLNYKGSRRVSR